MKEVGVALMKPWNLGTQMGEFKVIARRDLQLSIFDIIIIEMCGEVVAFCVGSCWIFSVALITTKAMYYVFMKLYEGVGANN